LLQLDVFLKNSLVGRIALHPKGFFDGFIKRGRICRGLRAANGAPNLLSALQALAVKMLRSTRVCGAAWFGVVMVAGKTFLMRLDVARKFLTRHQPESFPGFLVNHIHNDATSIKPAFLYDPTTA
jgi:hypothetical protein